MSATPDVDGDQSIVSATETPSSRRSALAEVDQKSITDHKLKLNKDLRVTLVHLTALKVLRNVPGKNLDVMGLVTMQPAAARRPKHGPRDYMLSFNITDQSMSPSQVIVVHIFRPHIESLPVVRPGDAVLLRQFCVVAMQDRGFGLRTGETSSWAVLEHDREDELPQIKGPPVELSDAEMAHGALLRTWYAALDDKSKDKIQKANQKVDSALTRKN
jgi:hypothetical protein